MISINSDEFFAYGDLNCPFCYGLNELLFKLEIEDKIEWRVIEHEPEARSDRCTLEAQSELACEVYTVRQRLPDVDISLPPMRPNTHQASLLLIEGMHQNPKKGLLLRRIFYRALWVDGHDISDPQVIEKCLFEAGFDSIFTPSTFAFTTLENWQLGWEKGAYDLRIPVLTNDREQKLLGLSSIKDTKHFLGGTQHTIVVTGVCEFKPRSIIAIVGDMKMLWPIIKELRQEYDIRLTLNKRQLFQIITTEEEPDLILIDSDYTEANCFSVCREMIANPNMSHIPAVFVADDPESIEIEAYRAGASDLIAKDKSFEVIKAKLSVLLQLKHSRDHLTRIASTDSLTQVFNRREFERNLELEWRRALRSKKSLSLAIIDVDGFKKYNDHYGHLAGDGCLRIIAQTISKFCKRAGDFVARYGGEEFVVILPECESMDSLVVIESARQAAFDLRIPHAPDHSIPFVTFSAGITSSKPHEGGNPRQLIEIADSRLYKAKQNGRNRIIWN